MSVRTLYFFRRGEERKLLLRRVLLGSERTRAKVCVALVGSDANMPEVRHELTRVPHTQLGDSTCSGMVVCHGPAIAEGFFVTTTKCSACSAEFYIEYEVVE